MKRYYYEIWADAVERAESSQSNMSYSYKDKKLIMFVIYSLAMGSNFALLLSLIGYFFDLFLFNAKVFINIFPGDYFDTALSGFITFFLPFGLINYYLLCYKKNYLKYMNNRKIDTGGKAVIFYFAGSQALYILIILAGKPIFGW